MSSGSRKRKRDEDVENSESPVARRGQKTLAKIFASSAEFADVTVTCRGVKFLAHKVILCNGCDFFAKALQSKRFQEGIEDQIDIGDSDPTVVYALLLFLYGSDYISPASTDIKTEEQFRDSALDTDGNWPDGSIGCKRRSIFLLGLWQLADRFDLPDLKAVAQARFTRMLQSSDAALLTQEKDGWILANIIKTVYQIAPPGAQGDGLRAAMVDYMAQNASTLLTWAKLIQEVQGLTDFWRDLAISQATQ